MEIGSKLKNARNEKGITQEQVAELLGVSRQTISNWENNKSYPDIISVIKMSDIYFISLDHLLKEEKSMKQTYQSRGRAVMTLKNIPTLRVCLRVTTSTVPMSIILS